MIKYRFAVLGGDVQQHASNWFVRLSAEEREHLHAAVLKGPARRLLKVRIPLKADVLERGPESSDGKIIAALETSASMLYRVCKQRVKEGFKAVLSRKQPPLFSNSRSVPARTSLRRFVAGQRDHLGLLGIVERFNGPSHP